MPRRPHVPAPLLALAGFLLAARPAVAQATLGLGLTPYSDGTYRVDARTAAEGAAGRAGVRVGDVLTWLEIEGRAVRIPDDLVAALGAARPGQVATLRVRRGWRLLTFRATLDAPPAAPAPPAPAAPPGAAAAPAAAHAAAAPAAAAPAVAPPAPAPAAPAGPAAPAAPTAQGAPRPGKYGCAESIPRLRNGAYEYESQGRGYVQLQAGGRYVDPYQVAGRYRFDAAAGETRFTGGALDGAVATPMAGERLWVVIPTASRERRWACSRMDG